ncbi:MAG: cytochrome c oxidase subunit [Actinomycetota bacterium]|jgi:cytochrome c oxidase subunit 4
MAAVDTHNDAHTDDAAHAGHPSELVYIKVALGLALATGVEVLLSYHKVGGEHGTVALLLILAVVKFATVVMYFMHLKFDHPYFRRLFAIGIVLAVGCYCVYLSTLHVFHRPPLPH